jgi:hypothetical protein
MLNIKLSCLNYLHVAVYDIGLRTSLSSCVDEMWNSNVTRCCRWPAPAMLNWRPQCRHHFALIMWLDIIISAWRSQFYAVQSICSKMVWGFQGPVHHPPPQLVVVIHGAFTERFENPRSLASCKKSSGLNPEPRGNSSTCWMTNVTYKK